MANIKCGLLLSDDVQEIIKKVMELKTNYKDMLEFQGFLSSAASVTADAQQMIKEAREADPEANVFSDEKIVEELNKEVEIKGIKQVIAEKLELSYQQSLVMSKLVDE